MKTIAGWVLASLRPSTYRLSKRLFPTGALIILRVADLAAALPDDRFDRPAREAA
jgi:hypothetical protein